MRSASAADTVMRVRTTPSPTLSTQTTPSALSITSTTRGSSSKSVSGPSALLSALARLAWLSDSSGSGIATAPPFIERSSEVLREIDRGPRDCGREPSKLREHLRRAARLRCAAGRRFGRSRS